MVLPFAARPIAGTLARGLAKKLLAHNVDRFRCRNADSYLTRESRRQQAQLDLIADHQRLTRATSQDEH
ncbi:MAG TPA: hypothetical protein VJM34_13800 [Novosphingobium sp.]|nr:hypothetical protein [Novosphingobium sp.]